MNEFRALSLRVFVWFDLGTFVRLVRMVSLPLLLICLTIHVPAASAEGALRQVIRVGSVTLYVPQEWLQKNFTIELATENTATNKPSDQAYIARMANIFTRGLAVPPGIISSELPDQISFLVIGPDAQRIHDQCRSDLLRTVQAYRDSHPDSDGRIWENAPGSIVVLGSEADYRLGQPLVIEGSLSRLTSSEALYRLAYAQYRIAPDVVIRVNFDLKVFPPEKWVAMDQAVHALISYMMISN